MVVSLRLLWGLHITSSPCCSQDRISPIHNLSPDSLHCPTLKHTHLQPCNNLLCVSVTNDNGYSTRPLCYTQLAQLRECLQSCCSYRSLTMWRQKANNKRAAVPLFPPSPAPLCQSKPNTKCHLSVCQWGDLSLLLHK